MSMRHFISVILSLLCLSKAVSAEADGPVRTPFFGVASHFLHTSTFYDGRDDSWNPSRTLPVINDLGTLWVTEGLYALANPRRALVDDGTLDRAQKAKLEQRRRLVDGWLTLYDQNHRRVLLAVLAATPKAKNFEKVNAEFADWLAELVKKHPSIVAVQMHNEPNLKSFWNGTPEEYVDVYRKIALEVKRANPNVKIIIGGLASLSWHDGMRWFRRTLKAGVLEFADGVSAHPYSLGKPPEVDPFLPPAKDYGQIQRAIGKFWTEVQSYNENNRKLDLYFTEFGYSSSREGLQAIGDESLKAKYLSRLLALFADARVQKIAPLEAVFWYDLKNDGNDPAKQEHNFGLVSNDLRERKPAFDFYKRTIEALPDLDDLVPAGATFTSQSADPLVLLQWKRLSSGEFVLPFWSPTKSESEVEIILPPSVVLESSEARVFDLSTGLSEKIAVVQSGSRRSMKITAKDSLSILMLP